MHLRRFKLTVLNYYCPENDGGMKLVGEHAEGRRHICWKEEAISASHFLHVAQRDLSAAQGARGRGGGLGGALADPAPSGWVT